MKYTDEELKLAPKVAEVMGLKNELFRICVGTWKRNADIVIGHYDGQGAVLIALDSPFYPDEIIPLPQIQDCLDWLKEKKYVVELNQGLHHCRVFIMTNLATRFFEERGDTLLEAADRVIIAVGEAGKEGG